MKDFEKHLTTATVVAGGVLIAGYFLNMFRTNSIVAQIRAGFTG